MEEDQTPTKTEGSSRPLLVGAVGLAAVIALATAFSQGSNRPISPLTQPSATAPASTGAVQTPEGEWIEWSADDGPKHYQVGQFGLDLAAVRLDEFNAAKVTFSDTIGGGAPYEWTGDGTWNASAKFALVRLESADITPQILLSSFSGGAHCCSTLTLVRREGARWLQTNLGAWDGDIPSLPKDLDGDGKKEFSFVDQNFLYAFASYAESWAPPVIHAVTNGIVRDVSEQRRFRPIFATDADRTKDACLQNSNGACAAYVASAARAGGLDQAWSVMLRSYDQSSDWTLPTACRIRTAGECPADAQQIFANFPEALQWFLGEHGYAPPIYLAPLNATGPSFACGGVTTPGELAVCTDPTLSTLDRTLAVAYTRASALSPDRASLRSVQQSFLRDRNGRSEPSDLARLYEARIGQLLVIE